MGVVVIQFFLCFSLMFFTFIEVVRILINVLMIKDLKKILFSLIVDLCCKKVVKLMSSTYTGSGSVFIL